MQHYIDALFQGWHIRGMDEVKKYYSNRGLTQNDLAAELGITQGTFSRILNGKSKVGLERALSIEAGTQGEVPITAWPEFAALKGRLLPWQPKDT